MIKPDFKPVMIMILDGFGLREERDYNAYKLANTPFIDSLFKKYPWSKLEASGLSVGLPEGQMGNSEVGHMNIGAGRIVYQDFTRINKAIEDGSFFKNQVLLNAINMAKKNNSKIHLLGLLSDGGVHSHINHLFAILRMIKQNSYNKVYIHCFMDGRDTPPTAGINYLQQLNEFIKKENIGRIASIMGRFYAMDRDRRWERIEKAYRIIVNGEGKEIKDFISEIGKRYEKNETDEFISPFLVDRNGTIKDNDVVIFYNFRADRARELTRALTEDDFNKFNISNRPKISYYCTMTMYDKDFSFPIIFPPEEYRNILGEVVSNYNLKQLRIAETEKYAHVTYFFNCGRETPFNNEDRVLIPSPKEIKTYDKKPEMSAFLVTDELLRRLDENIYDFIVLNYANPDMVGHTGVLEAAIKAFEALDKCVEKIVNKVLSMNGIVFFMSDHGNSELMIDEHGNPHTAHTTNKVPFVFISNITTPCIIKDGKLGDVAPTVLKFMGIKKPLEMEGNELIEF